MPGLLWAALSVLGVYLFVRLSLTGEPAPGEAPRSILDRTFPPLFLALSVYGAWQAIREWRRAAEPSEPPLRRVPVEPAAQSTPATGQPGLGIGESLDALQSAGVLIPGEVDRTEFFALAEAQGLGDGGLYEVASLLRDYQIDHGLRYANLAVFPDQVEFSDDDVVAMAGAFARLAGRPGDMTEMRVEGLSGSRARLHYRLDDAPGHLDFDYPPKNASGSLMTALRDLLDPDPPYALAYFDSVFLLTCLSDADMAQFNAAVADGERFERLS